MSEAPEQIWAAAKPYSVEMAYAVKPPEQYLVGYTEYVRADIAEALRAENERLTKLISSSEAERYRSCEELLARALAAEARAEKAGEWLAIVERIANFHPTWIAVARRDIIEAALASLPEESADV